jgi:hypothetical protein
MAQPQRKEMNDHFVVFDAGRSIVKGKSQSSEKSFTHALSQLTDTEYKQMSARDNNPELFKVNGIPYAIGETAVKRGYQPRMTTSERYNQIYYGTLLATMLFQLYEKPVKNVFLYASHPPVAIESRPDIIAAAKGKWTVESMGEKREYVIQEVRCFDEPVGGVMNLLLAGDGKSYAATSKKALPWFLTSGVKQSTLPPWTMARWITAPLYRLMVVLLKWNGALRSYCVLSIKPSLKVPISSFQHGYARRFKQRFLTLGRMGNWMSATL